MAYARFCISGFASEKKKNMHNLYVKGMHGSLECTREESGTLRGAKHTGRAPRLDTSTSPPLPPPHGHYGGALSVMNVTWLNQNVNTLRQSNC